MRRESDAIIFKRLHDGGGNMKTSGVSDPILVLATGGTFDKEYDEIRGRLYFRRTHLPEMLALGRSRLPTRLRVLMLKDSLDLKEADRRRILSACERSRERRIIITHGTDTMCETALYLGRRITDKTIVLTGAMVPYTFGSSDGVFNLGSSLAFVQTLPPGVYVAMNGRFFVWHAVVKNRITGVFEHRPVTPARHKEVPGLRHRQPS